MSSKKRCEDSSSWSIKQKRMEGTIARSYLTTSSTRDQVITKCQVASSRTSKPCKNAARCPMSANGQTVWITNILSTRSSNHLRPSRCRETTSIKLITLTRETSCARWSAYRITKARGTGRLELPASPQKIPSRLTTMFRPP